MDEQYRLVVPRLRRSTASDRPIALETSDGQRRIAGRVGFLDFDLHGQRLTLTGFSNGPTPPGWSSCATSSIPGQFDVKEAMKCCIGILQDDGRMIPFCTYNTIGYREETRARLAARRRGRALPVATAGTASQAAR